MQGCLKQPPIKDLSMKQHVEPKHIFGSTSGCDIILGVEWLRTLGPITMDFKELSLSFTKESHTHTLKEIHSGSFEIISYHRM